MMHCLPSMCSSDVSLWILFVNLPRLLVANVIAFFSSGIKALTKIVIYKVGWAGVCPQVLSSEAQLATCTIISASPTPGTRPSTQWVCRKHLSAFRVQAEAESVVIFANFCVSGYAFIFHFSLPIFE